MDGLLKIVESKAFKEAFAKIPDSIIKLNSEELQTKFRPTKVDYALRSAFWNEFRLSTLNLEKIVLNRVYSGICTYQHFYHNILNNPLKLAWLIQPYSDYQKELEPLIMKSVERLNDLLNIPIIDSKNEVDARAAKVLLEVIKLIDSKTEVVFKDTESKQMTSKEIRENYKNAMRGLADSYITLEDINN